MITQKNISLIKAITLSVMIMLFCGCQEKREVAPPEMFPVSGKVVTASGQVPAGYVVRLTPNDMDMEKVATGLILEDSSFVMQTNYMGERFDGVIKGAYRVALCTPYEKGDQMFDLPQVVDVSGEITDLTISFSSGR